MAARAQPRLRLDSRWSPSSAGPLSTGWGVLQVGSLTGLHSAGMGLLWDWEWPLASINGALDAAWGRKDCILM